MMLSLVANVCKSVQPRFQISKTKNIFSSQIYTVQRRIFCCRDLSSRNFISSSAFSGRLTGLSPNPKCSQVRKLNTGSSDEVEPQTQVVRKPAGYFSSLFQVWRTPAPALLTGLAGLAPFIAAPSYLYFYAPLFNPFIISAQLAYGAVILSFVGGLRWGFVIPYRHGSADRVTWKSIIQSTVPSLIAWGGLLIPDLTGGLVVVASGLLLALYNDLRLFGDYPKWMMGLRCLLTTVAVATLIISIILVEENRMKNVLGGRVQNKLMDKEI